MGSLFGLENRVTVVTGGLGKLGRQFVSAVVAHGGRAAVLDLLATDDRTLGGLVPEDQSGQVLSIAVDVTNRDSLQGALNQIEVTWETPVGLVNNAAIDSPPDAPAGENGRYEDFPDEIFDRV